MAGYVAPQFDNMAFLRNALGMQQFQQQGQMAPLELAGERQKIASGQLNLDMLRQSMGMKSSLFGMIQKGLAGQQQNGAQNIGGQSGGIQSGPQGQVSSQQPSQANIPDVTPLPISGASLQAVGMLAPDMVEGLMKGQAAERAQREDAINRNAMALQPAVDEIKNVIASPAPERLLMNNPSYLAAWRANAPRLGLDPSDPRAMTPDNVRAAATLAHNDLAARSYGKIAPISMPSQLQNIQGDYGQQLQRDPLTGKLTQVAGRELPTATQEKVWDPASGTMVLKSILTGGMTKGGVPIAGGDSSGAAGVPGGSRNLGMEKPNTENLKAAQFANYMAPALAKLSSIESSGFALAPSSRAAIINAATSEDTGALHSLMQQELLKHGMSSQGQAYMAALMPVLQAAGHAMGGARLTAGQMRANFESLIPVDAKNTEALSTINQNRESYLRGLIGEAGSAVQTPAYKDTLGKLAESYKHAGGAQHPTVGQVVKGYKYIGGPANSQKSWEKAGD